MTTKFKGLKRKRIKKFSLFFLLVFFIIFVLVVFNVADLFSSAITNKGSILYGEKIRITNNIYYGVSLYNSTESSNAETNAKNIAKQGGAGYLYCMGDYYVLGSIYSSYEDAIEVKEKLKSDNIEAKIININIPVININYKGKFLKENTDIFSCFSTLFNLLFDLSVEFDLGNITMQEVKKEVTKISTDFSDKINDFDDIYKKEKYEFQKLILENFNNLKLSIDSILTCNGVEFLLNSKLKNVCCEIVVSYYELAKVI